MTVSAYRRRGKICRSSDIKTIGEKEEEGATGPKKRRKAEEATK